MSTIQEELDLIENFKIVAHGKLRSTSLKEHWGNLSAEYFKTRILEEVEELKEEFEKKNKISHKIVLKAADVACFCMMLIWKLTKEK